MAPSKVKIYKASKHLPLEYKTRASRRPVWTGPVADAIALDKIIIHTPPPWTGPFFFDCLSRDLLCSLGTGLSAFCDACMHSLSTAAVSLAQGQQVSSTIYLAHSMVVVLRPLTLIALFYQIGSWEDKSGVIVFHRPISMRRNLLFLITHYTPSGIRMKKFPAYRILITGIM
jgi:hypothetical protein